MTEPNIKDAYEPEVDSVLRDDLAMMRTVFSSERTLLAYMRTSLTAVVVGITFYKLFSGLLVHMIGISLLISGIVLFAVGLYRHKKRKFQIYNERNSFQHHVEIGHNNPLSKLNRISIHTHKVTGRK